jgi:uncharacterized protein YeaO (DUF488 family)
MFPPYPSLLRLSRDYMPSEARDDMSFQLKRVYDAPAASDGTRILVDRLWPRGLKKTDGQLDGWMKEVAPSPDLRVWFDHQAERFDEFARRYKEEIASNAAVGALRTLGARKRVTLLYGARDPKVNHAVVLLSVLRGSPAKERSVKRKSPVRG